jgi:hypothetical protein
VFFVSVLLNIAKGQNEASPVCSIKYQYLIVNFNGHLLNYTSQVSDFNYFEWITSGFHDYKNQDSIGVFFGNGNRCKLQFIKVPEIDTINTVRWPDGNLPKSSQDSAIFKKKVWYSYMLFKFNENRLYKDSIRVIRLLLPADNISAQGKWYLFKVMFYKDSTIITAKLSDKADTNDRKIIKSVTKRISHKNRNSLLKEIDYLENFSGYECFQSNYYPWLLEYYDGKSEHCYIISNKCKGEKELKKRYGKIIMKTINLAPNIF